MRRNGRSAIPDLRPMPAAVAELAGARGSGTAAGRQAGVRGSPELGATRKMPSKLPVKIAGRFVAPSRKSKRMPTGLGLPPPVRPRSIP